MMTIVVPATPFERFCERWKNGCGSDQCDGVRKVFFRGKMPCGILVVGEAPGESEDLLGFPFRGPAGIEQDRLLARVNESTEGRFQAARVGFCNIVGCIPREGGKKAGTPLPEQVMACKPRTEQLLELCQPKLIIAAGQEANDYLESGYRYSIKSPKSVAEVVHVTHPAAILRAKVVQQGLMRQRYIFTVANAVRKHF